MCLEDILVSYVYVVFSLNLGIVVYLVYVV